MEHISHEVQKQLWETLAKTLEGVQDVLRQHNEELKSLWSTIGHLQQEIERRSGHEV